MSQNPKKIFEGFNEDHMALIRMPETFFTSLLNQINDLTQLRTILYLFWHIEQQEDDLHFFRLTELAADPALIEMVGNTDRLQDALTELVEQGILLTAKPSDQDSPYYFMNVPQGRAAVAAIQSGEWQDSQTAMRSIHLIKKQPNIFQLYENNIGVITPMMADVLKMDEETYPAAWIEDAIRMAVTRNVRNWKYIQAILERWQKEGRRDEQNRRNDSQDPGSYRESWLRKE